jgi:GT2 family glycosyltransferase
LPPSKDISIIIVNYNVVYFLEQCLNSVFNALGEIPSEVFVVDNNSIDESVEMVQQKFPQVHLIANKENVGFSRANNQAIEISNGRYILLLNPDTVVSEDTFSKTISFLDSHPDAGALGVRMIDGKGNFLPESKRGLPTPSVAFYKIFGLSSLFPNSKKFGRYHLGYLPETKTNKVDVLSGAFMLLRKETLNKTGYLDEDFFMYGEDIDLSYRVQLAGYENYYFADTKIIHYKGESTKKSSVNYVFVFYNAMVIFAKKHFSHNNAALFSLLINIAIYLRAGIAILVRFLRKAIVPITDITLLLSLLYFLTNYWKQSGITFEKSVLATILPTYLLIWIVSVYYSGGYDKPIRLKKYITGSFIGMLIILIGYALLPKSLQFSRLFILIGSLLVCSYFIFSRLIFHLVLGGKFSLAKIKPKRFAIIGSQEETSRVESLLKQSHSNLDKLFFVSPSEEKNQHFIGTLNQLDQIIFIHSIDEVIFCSKDIPSKNIIQWMLKMNNKPIDFKIAQPDTLFLIGSNSIHTNGELYTLNIYNINSISNKRLKRLFDLLISLSLILFLPFIIWKYKNKSSFVKNLALCLIGKKTLVGYEVKLNDQTHLKSGIQKGILSPSDNLPFINQDVTEKLNLIYARDYTIWKDLEILQKSWKKLDKQV